MPPSPLPSRLGAAYTTDVASRHTALLPLLLVVGACRTVEPTACDGFAERKLAIGGAEYRGLTLLVENPEPRTGQARVTAVPLGM